MNEVFQSGTALANLGVLGILGTAVVALSVIVYKAYQREIRRADFALEGWNSATAQFERAMDVIDKMNDQKRRAR